MFGVYVQLELIKRKFDAFKQELEGKASVFAELNTRATELLAGKHSRADNIAAEQDHINAL